MDISHVATRKCAGTQVRLNHDPTLADTESLELPDLQFVTLLFERYGLNRGIYNTIDEWLYRFGIKQVIRRRQIIMNFLMTQHSQFKGTYLKFGKGSFTKLLEEYTGKANLI